MIKLEDVRIVKNLIQKPINANFSENEIKIIYYRSTNYLIFVY